MSLDDIIESIQSFSEIFNFSSETELNSLSHFLVSQTEGKRYHNLHVKNVPTYQNLST